MKQKGYSDAYWRPRLGKAEERWWVARLEAAEKLRDVAVCTARRLAVDLSLERAKIRSIRRRLRRRHVFGLITHGHAMVVTLTVHVYCDVL